ncbi:MAG: LysR substrate-binding domain-containing protein [Bacteroidia bacterium]
MMPFSYQLELRHLRYFLAVAQELNYRRAAARLCISQPGLSRQIRQVEELLGVALFVRDKKRVRLTAAGTHLQQEAAFLLGRLDQACRYARSLHAGQAGEIRVGFVGSAMQQVIPRLMVQMHEAQPGVTFSLEEMSISKQLEALADDRLDIGFVRVGRVPEGMRLLPVQRDHFTLVLPADHPVDASNFTDMRQLADDNFILFASDYSPTYFDNVMSICEDAGFSPRISHRSVHANTIFRLVECGLGVSIIPDSFRLGFDLNIKFVELRHIRQATVLSAVWHEANRNPALQGLLAFLQPV